MAAPDTHRAHRTKVRQRHRLRADRQEGPHHWRQRAVVGVPASGQIQVHPHAGEG